MASYQILYWHELPAQVRASDDHEDVNLQLPPEFQERIDEVALRRGLASSDAYLDGWQWSEPMERPGSAKDVAEAVIQEIERAN